MLVTKILLVVMLFMSSSIAQFAQTTGSLQGSITDPQGLPLASA